MVPFREERNLQAQADCGYLFLGLDRLCCHAAKGPSPCHTSPNLTQPSFHPTTATVHCRFFDGSVAHLLLFDRALTPQNVAGLYQIYDVNSTGEVQVVQLLAWATAAVRVCQQV